MSHRILLVDDDATLVTVLGYALAQEGYVVENARDGETAVAPAAAGRFDLIVLDIGLPEMNGFDVCRDLRTRGVVIPVVVLTGRYEVSDKVTALSLGADDYVTKPFDTRELLARIQALLRRSRSHGAGTSEYQFGGILVDFLKGKVVRDGQLVNVSAKELQLLRYLVARRGAILSRRELLTEVWGYQSELTRTVDVHVSTLRQKLEENPQQPRYLLTVRGEGYMFCG
ncbi:MAG: response regulator transcription factor [Bryobacteraceae bacterium]|nr:response regulator transcription factor [Bryobacteraceae bacterium]